MVPLYKAIASFYRLLLVTLSSSTAVWPKFATQRCRLHLSSPSEKTMFLLYLYLATWNHLSSLRNNAGTLFIAFWWQTFTIKRKILMHFAATVVAGCFPDIAFVIDNSGSIRENNMPGGNNWQLIIDFVRSIIDKFTIGPRAARVAVVDFG